MKKIYLFVLSVALMLFLTSIVQIKAEVIQGIKEKQGFQREELRKMQELQEIRKKEMLEKREIFRGKIASDKAILKEKIKTEKLDLQEKKKEIIAKYKTERQEFKTKVKKLRDKQKVIIVERIDNNLSTVNKNRTNQMTLTLDKLSSILDRLTAKVEAATASGKNTTDVKMALDQAKSALAAAQQAVSAQANKEYVIKINTEDALKTDIGSVVSQLEKDLRDTHKTVIDAKQAIQKAASELAKISGNISISPTTTVY